MVGCIVSMVGADRLCKIIVYVQNPRLKNQKKTVQRETLKNGEDKPGMPD
jgi:hypothetical protein